MWPLFVTVIKSPIFKLSDFSSLMKAYKANKKTTEYMGAFDLNSESAEYKVPIYYILGENDWQVPYVIAKEYFNNINAPRKNIYLIPNAGHFTMLDQGDLFFDALCDINNKEKDN